MNGLGGGSWDEENQGRKPNEIQTIFVFPPGANDIVVRD